MKVLNRKTIDDFHQVYIETEVETEKFGIVFVNVTKDDFNEKTPFDETEVWVYSKSYEENSADDDINNYGVRMSDEELKEVYNFVLNN